MFEQSDEQSKKYDGTFFALTFNNIADGALEGDTRELSHLVFCAGKKVARRVVDAAAEAGVPTLDSLCAELRLQPPTEDLTFPPPILPGAANSEQGDDLADFLSTRYSCSFCNECEKR